jgi:hypothetical protein
MSQRKSGHARVPADLYQTPPWLIADALDRHFPLDGKHIWECAAGEGQMVRALKAAGAKSVLATDILQHSAKFAVTQHDFLKELVQGIPRIPVDTIATNPPYGFQGRKGHAFAKRGLEYIRAGLAQSLALLLPVDFDSAKGRADIFRDCDLFDLKIVLTKRIVWFEPPPREDGKKNHGPSANHAWFVWQSNRGNKGRAGIAYAP